MSGFYFMQEIGKFLKNIKNFEKKISLFKFMTIFPIIFVKYFKKKVQIYVSKKIILFLTKNVGFFDQNGCF